MAAMEFSSSAGLRAEVLTACRVLTHFRIAEGFGHVSVRVPGSERFLVTPRRALGLVTETELVELDLDGNQLAGEGRRRSKWRCMSRSIAAVPRLWRWRAAIPAMSRPMPAPPNRCVLRTGSAP